MSCSKDNEIKTPIVKSLHQDSVVLTFEYKSKEIIDRIQIFFGPTITEERSVFGGSMSGASAWKSYSVNLAKEIKGFSWGKPEDFIRIDFGTKNGIDIEIRNIYFRSLNQSERGLLEENEAQIKKDDMIQNALATYLKEHFTSSITEVNVGLNNITVSGEYRGEGKFSLCEVFPNDTLVTTKIFKNKI